MHVLVVEDEALIRMLIVETLEDQGLKTLEAASGIDALRLIDDPDDVGLLVTDINMPGPDGVTVAREIRARHPELPILFISGRPDRLRSLTIAAPYHVLAKPFSMEELSAVVEEMLGRRAAPRS